MPMRSGMDGRTDYLFLDARTDWAVAFVLHIYGPGWGLLGSAFALCCGLHIDLDWDVNVK